MQTTIIIDMSDVSRNEGRRLAHDLNNKLGTISGYAQLMGKKCQDNEEIVRYIKTIIDVCKEGASLVESIKTITQNTATTEPAMAEPHEPAVLLPDNNDEGSQVTGSADILIVDDERFLADLLKEMVQENGYSARRFLSAEACLNALAGARFRLAIIDYLLPGMNGLALIKRIRETIPGIKTILLTGVSNDQEIRTLAKVQGIDHYLKKPLDLSLFYDIVQSACPEGKTAGEGRRAAELDIAGGNLLIGASVPMKNVKELITRLARVDANLLITGDTGTGKEIAARSIHQHSARKHNAFIPVNCASLPEGLLESELFGHEKGAFTNAVQAKKGMFELADKGTLFLDEIGDMNPHLQAKVLRAIQERKIWRVGGTAEISVDVRIISATHRDLEKMVAEASFREDLYYRLNVVKIRMPRLAERKDDMPLFVEYIKTKYNRNNPGVLMKTITPEAMESLCGYAWPGNVRELENVLLEAFILSRDGEIKASDLPIKLENKAYANAGTNSLPSLEEYQEKFRRGYVIELLRKYKGNVTLCAQHAKINRASFHKILYHYDIDQSKFKK